MNGFRKIFPIFLSHYPTFFAKIAKRKVVPFDEFYYQLKLMYLFQKHPVPGEMSFIVSAKTSTSNQFKILKKFRNDCVSL
jgi:hypothetical protein